MRHKLENLQVRLDNYIKEYELIEQEAIKMGANIKNNKIVPPKNNKVYLIDSFFYGQTQYESEGEYYIQKQSRVATKLQVNLFSKMAESTEITHQKKVFLDIWEENVDDDIMLYGADAMSYGDDYLKEEDIKYINTTRDESGDLLLEILLEDTKKRWHGYISVFKGTNKTYEELKCNEMIRIIKKPSIIN